MIGFFIVGKIEGSEAILLEGDEFDIIQTQIEKELEDREMSD